MLRHASILLIGALLSGAATHCRAETVLHTFTGSPDGQYPVSPLVSDGQGNLYGTTAGGGDLACQNGYDGCGAVFELTPTTDGNWKFQTIFQFDGYSSADPLAGLLFDGKGNLYGTTANGGLRHGLLGYGTVFKLHNANGVWKETVLYRFNEKDGYDPVGSLVLDNKGNIYGTTGYGGDPGCSDYGAGCGLVFELTPAGKGWREHILHIFTGPDGADPMAAVVFDKAGSLYGTTWYGGSGNAGVVYRLTPSQNGWVGSTLYSFARNKGQPLSALQIDAKGNLYGTAKLDGIYASGSVFELKKTAAASWTLISLHSFTGGTDGWFPVAGVTFDPAGNIYGTTYGGTISECQDGCGVVFMLNKKEGWAETTLHAFTGGADGAYPSASVLLDAPGNVYGTAANGGDDQCMAAGFPGCGVVFKITP